MPRLTGHGLRAVGVLHTGVPQTDFARRFAVYRTQLLVYGRKEGNVLFNDALNTFYMASDIW